MDNLPVIISRGTHPITLDGIYAPTLEILLEWLERNAKSSDWLFADLSLDSWRGSLVATEFCAQLGLLPPKFAQPSSRVSKEEKRPFSYADRIGVLIDAEGSGDRVILNALEAATRIVTKVQDGLARTFVIVPPRFELPWEREDLLFLRFLAQGLRGTKSRIILAASDEGVNVSGDWHIRWINEPGLSLGTSTGLLGLVPGVVSSEVYNIIKQTEQDEETKYFRMPNGSLLIAPESRQNPKAVPQSEINRLISAATDIAWLKAYAQYFRKSSAVDLGLLSAEASHRFSEGGYGIALRLLDHAIACSPNVMQRSILTMQAQGMRIALLRFEEAAQIADPAPEIHAFLRGFLCQTKGWGLVMTGHPSRAEPYFHQARELLKSEAGSREHLYLLNISALNFLRRGDPQRSLEIEKHIEKALAQSDRPDWQLHYVNSINSARLYRRQQIFDEAARYYDRAFATTLGARSESDSVYGNVCWAGLHSECGSAEQAFKHWFLAALHWVSSIAPEALGPRSVLAILGHKLPAEEDFTEAVSAKLAHNLFASAKAANLESVVSAMTNLNVGKSIPPTFIKSNYLNGHEIDRRMWCAVGADGWGVILMQQPLPSQYTGEKHQHLRLLLCKLIEVLGSFPEINNFGTIIVDDIHGREIPKTAYELLNTCVRLKVPKMIFDTSVVRLNDERRSSLEYEFIAQLSDAVEKVETNGSESLVIFKRYLSPMSLSQEQAAVLASLCQSGSVKELAKNCKIAELDQLINMLRILEDSRVINLWISRNLDTPGLSELSV